MSIFSLGMGMLCRDAERLITHVDSSSDHFEALAIKCVGADELTRGHGAACLTQLDRIISVYPCQTKLEKDDSGSYNSAKFFLRRSGISNFMAFPAS